MAASTHWPWIAVLGLSTTARRDGAVGEVPGGGLQADPGLAAARRQHDPGPGAARGVRRLERSERAALVDPQRRQSGRPPHAPALTRERRTTRP